MNRTLEHEIYLSGASDENGVFRIFEKNEWNDFLKRNAGHRITFYARASPPGKRAAYMAYYFSVAMPRIRQGFINRGMIISDDNVEEELRKLCHLWDVKPNADNTGYTKRLRRISELSDAELYDYVETVKYIAAEYLNTFIDDPINY